MAEKSLPSPLWPADNPAVIMHVTMLQGIISRLANNSASCKTWCLTLVTAVLISAATSHIPILAGLGLIPVVAFGFLDAMYLAQERAYRRLLSSVENSIQLGSYTIGQVYNAAAPLEPQSIWLAFRSWAVSPIYIGILLADAISMAIEVLYFSINAR